MLGLIGGIGTQELIIIFVIALIIFGPSKLPELGKALGRGINEFKKASSGVKKEINDAIQETVKETDGENNN